MKSMILIVGILMLANCELIDQNHFDIEIGLRPFVANFYDESIKRGVRVQRENLLVYLMKLDGLMGETMTSTAIPTIHIDEAIFDKYINKKPLYIEYVVFHELGHALLHRDHLDSYTIMTANNKMLYSYDNSEQARKLLLDELFGAAEIVTKPLVIGDNSENLILQDCNSHIGIIP
jgi:hypothetical protein